MYQRQTLQRSDGDLRAALVAEAMTWIGTPWHHESRVKGAGVDCAQLLIAVFVARGLFPDFRPEHYPADWMLHQDEPRFMQELQRKFRRVETPLQADVVMFKIGRQPAHGGLWLSGDRVLHAWKDEGRVTISDIPGSPLAECLHGYYRWEGFA